MDWIFLIERVKDDLMQAALDSDPNDNVTIYAPWLIARAEDLIAVLKEIENG